MSHATLLPQPISQPDGPVECLGMTFESDEARRAYFAEKLREKLRDPEFRAIEGFPIGSDQDILALSDPPYYTACPNPFVEEFIRVYGRPYSPNEPYDKEPFAADVREGKNDSIYLAHSYHTKVPHKAIMRYILHYTQPGDIVLDGFCGTGMTGVAAQMCADPDPEFKQKIEQEWKEAGWGKPEWGARRAILGDLSTAATFIAYKYNLPLETSTYEQRAESILAEVEREYGWMYETQHEDGSVGKINYVVWSDVFICPDCTGEIVFWDVAADLAVGKLRERFPCPHCGTEQTKRSLKRCWQTIYETVLQKNVRQAKQVPVLINYTAAGKRYEKLPDTHDRERMWKIDELDISYWFPTNSLPTGHNTKQPMDSHGFTHIHHFYHKQALAWLSKMFHENGNRSNYDWATFSMVNTISKLYRYTLKKPDYKGQGGGILTATLYVPALIRALSAPSSYRRAISRLVGAMSQIYQLSDRRNVIIATESATRISVADSSVDYIFIDPPFGENLMYSEVNFLWESWLRVHTNNQPEAIVNQFQNKSLLAYQRLMELCFREYFRVLKPGRWMTVEFSNTQAAVWNALQVALEQAGFVVANVAALDKKQLSFRAVTTPTAVKRDLVISCYKPNGGLEARFQNQHDSEKGAWEFVRSHLQYLPTFLSKDARSIEIVERTPRILYDRLVAYFVRHGYPVPLSTQEFQAGLARRFPERDGMYFLPEQIAEYERRRMTVREIQQLQICIDDESTAIQWIRQQLTNKPQTSSDLTPEFMKELKAWQTHEVQLELIVLLRENFLRYDGHGPIAAQVVAWMKKSADLRDAIKAEIDAGRASEDNGALTTRNRRLIAAARDRWYVPDPNRAIDLEKLRLNALLKEFTTYKAGEGRLRQFRTEAVRAGFSQAYKDRDFATIVRVAERLPESVVQEDPDLLIYYDAASLRAER